MEATSGRLTLGGTLDSKIPVALYKATAYVAAPDRVQAVDTATGHITATIRPQGEPLSAVETMGDDNPAQAPAVVTRGTPTVVAPFLIEQAGTGTQADHIALEVTGSNADTGTALWRMSLRLPAWADGALDLHTAVAGTSGGMGAVVVAGTYHSITYGIDLASHRQVWAKDGFEAASVAGSTVAGTTLEAVDEHQRAVGYDITTGKHLWDGQDSFELAAYPAGPDLVLVQGRDYGSGNHYHRLLDARTGATKQDMPAELAGSSCDYDLKRTLVCSGTGSPAEVAYAFDATSGAALWHLPNKQADRIAPEVTAAWHGRVYGRTKNGPVALDARTGKDTPAQPDLAPILVDESAGLALDHAGDNLMAYPTTG
ncbi:outer membrane protein assembly factor BamB family protein [Streptomyces sp. NPDC002004]